MSPPRPVTLRHIILYGLGDIYGGGSFILISLLYYFFLTEEVGLSPVLAGLVVGVGKFWDGASDPFVGYLSDGTRSRFGRRRLYFLVGLLPVALTFYLLWVPVRLESPWLTAGWHAFAMLLFNTVFSLIMVPYAALGAELSEDYQVRNRLTAVRMAFSLLSSALSGTLPDLLLKSAPTRAEGFMWIGAAFGLLYMLPWPLVFLGTWEAPAPAAPPRRFRLREALVGMVSLLRSRSSRLHILMYICAYTAMDALLMLFPYYLKWNLNRAVQAQAMGSLMAAQVLTIPVYTLLANRTGQATAFRVGLGVFGVGVALSTRLEGSEPLGVLMATTALIGAGLSAAVMMPWAMFPSLVDVDELVTGQSRSGQYSAAMTLIRKLVQALIATQAIALCLELIGYQEGASAQAASTVTGLKWLFFSLPLAFILLGMGVSLRFLITPQRHALLRLELSRLRRGGSKEEAPLETRQVLEALTGVPYGSLYPAPAPERARSEAA